jgi:hypothetical protein
MSESLPERINVMKVITYDVQQIVNDLIESGQEDGTVTIDDVMGYVEELAREDFSCGWGHEHQGDLIFQTDDGGDL